MQPSVSKVILQCSQCGKDFQVQPHRLRQQKIDGYPIRYCSMQCCLLARRRDNYTCTKCGEKKGPNDFHKNDTQRGYTAQCKACRNGYKSRVTVLTPNYRRHAIRANAMSRGLRYTLTRDQFMSFWQKPCTYCGDDIETIGLDRIDNTKGYVMGNVVPCCGTCNAMKSNQTMNEFLDRCQRIAERKP